MSIDTDEVEWYEAVAAALPSMDEAPTEAALNDTVRQLARTIECPPRTLKRAFLRIALERSRPPLTPELTAWLRTDACWRLESELTSQLRRYGDGEAAINEQAMHELVARVWGAREAT